MLDRTRALIDKTLKDLARVSYWLTIGVQSLLLALNVYKIVINVERTLYFVFYIVLGVVSIANLILFIATYRHKKHKMVVFFKRIGRYVKYFVNFCIIGLVLFEFATVGAASNLDIIFSTISILTFVGQIVFEIVSAMYIHYLGLFEIAIEKDFEFIKNWSDPKTTIIKKAGNIFSSIADKIHGVEKEEATLSEKEQYIENLTDDYLQKNNEKKEEMRSVEKEKTKDSFKRIFKKRSKDE
ncbi:MAG: hypothetical protein MJ239_05370 [Bacilli bacterium]|nr:hypothetical protein [Bacilli bacterium]